MSLKSEVGLYYAPCTTVASKTSRLLRIHSSDHQGIFCGCLLLFSWLLPHEDGSVDFRDTFDLPSVLWGCPCRVHEVTQHQRSVSHGCKSRCHLLAFVIASVLLKSSPEQDEGVGELEGMGAHGFNTVRFSLAPAPKQPFNRDV